MFCLRKANVLFAFLVILMVAGQLGLKSSRPLSQVGPGSTRPESTQPGVFSERSVTYMYMYTERNFQTATRYFLIYLNIYDTYRATIYIMEKLIKKKLSKFNFHQ